MARLIRLLKIYISCIRPTSWLVGLARQGRSRHISDSLRRSRYGYPRGDPAATWLFIPSSQLQLPAGPQKTTTTIFIDLMVEVVTLLFQRNVTDMRLGQPAPSLGARTHKLLRARVFQRALVPVSKLTGRRRERVGDQKM